MALFPPAPESVGAGKGTLRTMPPATAAGTLVYLEIHWRTLIFGAGQPRRTKPMKRLFAVFAILAATLGLSGCGYNTLQSGDEQIKAAWAEVLNQYQRRADLVPNLVNTVKGFAEQEKS